MFILPFQKELSRIEDVVDLARSLSVKHNGRCGFIPLDDIPCVCGVCWRVSDLDEHSNFRQLLLDFITHINECRQYFDFELSVVYLATILDATIDGLDSDTIYNYQIQLYADGVMGSSPCGKY